MVSQSIMLLFYTIAGFLIQSDDRVMIIAFILLLPNQPLMELWKRGTTSYVRTSMYIWVIISLSMVVFLSLLPFLLSTHERPDWMAIRLDWMTVILIPAFVVLFYAWKHDFQEDVVIRGSKEISEEYYNGA
ncbi:MAG: hypothetical protein ACFFAY_01445 [Promethearchaeota archaeon]